jgi:hypothetical protein
MVMYDPAGTGKLQVLSASGTVLYGAESNTEMDFITNNARRMGITAGGAFNFGSYGNPYAMVDFVLGNKGQGSATHLFRLYDGTYNNLFVVKSGLVGILNLNPSYPLDVGGVINSSVGFRCGGTAPVADGTYVVGARLTPSGNDGTITTKGGIITAIQPAT